MILCALALLFQLFAATATALPPHIGTADQRRLQQGVRHKRGASQISLPKVSTIMDQPDRTFKELSSKTISLEERFVQHQTQNVRALKKQKAEYEKRLRDQFTENRATERMNRKLSQEIEDLQQANTRIRAKANKVSKENDELRGHLQGMLSNISLAQEFANGTLGAARELFHEAPELQVLADLAQKDAAEEQEQLHQHHLNLIGGGLKISMFQADAGARPRQQDEQGDPADLLQSLLASLSDLTKQEEASSAQLKEAFERESKKSDEQREALLQKQAELNATLSAEAALHERLVSALNFVQATNKRLLKHSTSLRNFALRLGAAGHHEAAHQQRHVRAHNSSAAKPAAVAKSPVVAVTRPEKQPEQQPKPQSQKKTEEQPEHQLEKQQETHGAPQHAARLQNQTKAMARGGVQGGAATTQASALGLLAPGRLPRSMPASNPTASTPTAPNPTAATSWLSWFTR